MLIFTGCSTQTPNVPEPKTTTTPQVEYTEVKDTTYTIKVPTEWDNSVEKNKRIVTQKDTGSEICVLVTDFTPDICNTNQDALTKAAQTQNKTISTFTRQRGNIIDYTLEYQNSQGNSMFELRRLCWSHEKVYNIYYKAETKYYDTFLDIFKTMLSSFQPTDNYSSEMTYKDLWGMDENMAPFYLSPLRVYAEYPISWTRQDIENGATFTDAQTGSVVTISYTGAIPYFNTCTELQYLDFLVGDNAYNLTVTSFFNNGYDQMVGELVYSVDGTPYYMKNVLMNMGNATLLITYECTQSVAGTNLPVFENLIKSLAVM